MNSIKQIINAFQNADEEQQLYMFLTYRDLRSDFMEIVQNQNQRAVPRLEKKKGKSTGRASCFAKKNSSAFNSCG
jgi:hypothetical protein